MTCGRALVGGAAGCDARFVNLRMRQWTDDLLSPLAIAAYVAWGVVWAGSGNALAASEPAALWWSRGMMIVFLLAFAASISDRLASRPGAYRVACLVLAVCALGVVSLSRSGVTPILLVLLVAVLAAHLRGRELLWWFVGLNVCFVAIMVWDWRLEGRGLWITAIAQISFQAFAAMLMRSARRAEEMADQLRATNAELLTTRTLLAESARDQERVRLSRELHDVAGHGLTALKLNLELLARDPRQPDPRRVATSLALADELLQDLRRVVREMRDDEGIELHAALERLGAPFPRPRLHLTLPDGLHIVDRDQVEVVLRAVQEALTNAARHGHARSLHVTLRADGAEWALCIEDDGRAPEQVRAGDGLSGMRERFEQLRGSLRIGRGALGGLRLDARWPKANAT